MSVTKTILFKRVNTRQTVNVSNYTIFPNNQIEIIEFNYDGEGNALVIKDGEKISVMNSILLKALLCSGIFKLSKGK